ncbi:MAG: ABC transporter substrate-binding protein [Halocynthiibacter sp.]
MQSIRMSLSHFKSLVLSMMALCLFGSPQGQARDLPFAVGAPPFDWADYMAFAGEPPSSGRLRITGPWAGVDGERFRSILAYFEAATGIKTTFEGSDRSEEQLLLEIAAGTPPDLAIIPQPGLMRSLAKQGKLAPLPKGTSQWVADNYAAGASWVALSDMDGDSFGFLYKTELKSLIWYNPATFADLGYAPPQTFEALQALTARMIKEGRMPWCMGAGSGGASGWPATDWIEDLMLRLEGPEFYDQWVAHGVPFNDVRVQSVFDAYGAFARGAKMVEGGGKAVATRDFREAAAQLTELPPRCMMLRQASFIPAFFPKDTIIGRDVDFTYFPTLKNAKNRPILGSGTFVTMPKQSPEAERFIDFLKLPIAHELWMAQSMFLTPHKGVDGQLAKEPSNQKMQTLLRAADIFRFDGSDMMPGGIGAGAFWRGMLDYLAGQSAADVTGKIEAAWPK